MKVKNPFLQEVEAFLTAYKMHPTNFGIAALKDGKFISTLRNGRDTRRTTEDKVRAFMAKYAKKHPQPSNQAQEGAAA